MSAACYLELREQIRERIRQGGRYGFDSHGLTCTEVLARNGLMRKKISFGLDAIVDAAGVTHFEGNITEVWFWLHATGRLNNAIVQGGGAL